jgi:hypothetical protein
MPSGQERSIPSANVALAVHGNKEELMAVEGPAVSCFIVVESQGGSQQRFRTFSLVLLALCVGWKLNKFGV